uniref:Uncharacterized protein n=1 Tax=Candidatus Kentrum sp. LPFa TaxID=2126335 RepID=A0A450VN58_9GAMM|nr:MAG: hypothetical protein BECKLPF1236A_GA0070988_1000211 [Candidatus Kentron sp. LPFa]VFK25411.1 MAG: hypothetical protein BECKLPF1236C_GA0070990_1002114 [Candidatus Kentron sp. LPFa]
MPEIARFWGGVAISTLASFPRIVIWDTAQKNNTNLDFPYVGGGICLSISPLPEKS